MPASETTSTFETITFQLAMAFGQGAGTMLATPGAVTAALAPFRDSYTNNVSQWDDWALKSIEFARALGQASSIKAVMDGSIVITSTHVGYALERAGANELLPLGGCNCIGVERSSNR